MSWHEALACAALALVTAAALLVLRLREPLITDEAYLWYGTLRLTEGRVPHTDFKSYEPGRYVWCGAFAMLFGRDLGVLRLATHAFYSVGLTAALCALRVLGLGWTEIGLSGVLLSTWAYPAFKLYEPVLWMVGFWSAVWLTLSPGPLSALTAGATVGGALFFGFNYFLYLGASQALLWLVPPVSQSLRWDLLPWAGLGCLLGAAPFGAMCCLPGFLRAFAERRFWSILARSSTNLPLPIPWPWRATPGHLMGFNRRRQETLKWLFLVLPLLPAVTLLFGFLGGPGTGARVWTGAIVAATLGATGWHHALSRADEAHLAQAMPPLLLLLICLLTLLPGPHPPVVLALTLASLATTWPFNHWVRRRAAPQHFERFRIGPLTVWMPSSECRLIECAFGLSRRELGDRGRLLALPTLLGLYPILELEAPVYDTFCVFPASESAQARMLASIKGNDVRLAIISNTALDGREELRFSATHPRIWEYLQSEMESVEGLGLAPDVHFFRIAARSLPSAHDAGTQETSSRNSGSAHQRCSQLDVPR